MIAPASFTLNRMRTLSSDAYFAKGARHRVCEDYAMAGWDEGVPYAVVSDGCSSSPMTDVGARLLAHSARRELERRGALDVSKVLRRARLSQRALGLVEESLDATLLMAWQEGDRVRVVAVGDGVIVARRRSGLYETWRIEEQGAPVYLSYLDSPERQRALFAAGYGERTVHHHCEVWTCTHSTATQWLGGAEGALDDKTVAFTLSLPAQDLDQLLLLSDGVMSFEERSGSRVRPIPFDEVATELMAFKSTQGAFIERRARRFLNKTCEERGWSHYDDISIAGFVVPSLDLRFFLRERSRR